MVTMNNSVYLFFGRLVSGGFCLYCPLWQAIIQPSAYYLSDGAQSPFVTLLAPGNLQPAGENDWLKLYCYINMSARGVRGKKTKRLLHARGFAEVFPFHYKCILHLPPKPSVAFWIQIAPTDHYRAQEWAVVKHTHTHTDYLLLKMIIIDCSSPLNCPSLLNNQWHVDILCFATSSIHCVHTVH